MKYQALQSAHTVLLAVSQSASGQVASHAPHASPSATAKDSLDDRSQRQAGGAGERRGADRPRSAARRCSPCFLMRASTTAHSRGDGAGHPQWRDEDDHLRGTGVPGGAAAENDGLAGAAATSAEADFRKQFATPEEYQQFLKAEFQGSRAGVARKDQALAADRATAEGRSGEQVHGVARPKLKAYYDKNPERFQYPESFAFQTISILPPEKADASAVERGSASGPRRAGQAKAAKTDEAVWAAGGKDLRRRLPRDDGRPQGRGSRQAAAAWCRPRWPCSPARSAT